MRDFVGSKLTMAIFWIHAGPYITPDIQREVKFQLLPLFLILSWVLVRISAVLPSIAIFILAQKQTSSGNACDTNYQIKRTSSNINSWSN